MLPVQRSAIARKASTDAERNRYSQFSASETWVKKFISHNNLKSLTLHGQAGSVNVTSLP